MDTRSNTSFPIINLSNTTQLKDSTSEFRQIDVKALNIVYEDTETIVDLSDNFYKELMIQHKDYKSIFGCSKEETMLCDLNDMEKTYAIALDYVLENELVVRGTDESRTDTLVSYILHGVGLGKYPFFLRIHPIYKFFVENKSITSVFDFAVVKTNKIIIVEEDKHMKNVSPSNGWGETQIAGELLAAAYTNYSTDIIYAIRVIGTKFTFYKTFVTIEYLDSLGNGFPASQMKIMRKTQEYSRNETPGFDYREPDKRLLILQTLSGIRDSLINNK